MPDESSYSLEPIENSDLDLGSKLKGQKESSNAGLEKIKLPEKENGKEGVAEKDNAYGKILSKVKKTQQGDDSHDISDDAKSLALKTDSESQIQHLVDIAMQKGVIYAVKVAKHAEDNYIMDKFHDKIMSDELHDALVAKGMIGE